MHVDIHMENHVCGPELFKITNESVLNTLFYVLLPQQKCNTVFKVSFDRDSDCSWFYIHRNDSDRSVLIFCCCYFLIDWLFDWFFVFFCGREKHDLFTLYSVNFSFLMFEMEWNSIIPEMCFDSQARSHKFRHFQNGSPHVIF